MRIQGYLFVILQGFLILACVVKAQRVAPGVNPQHYQPNQPQYQQMPQQQQYQQQQPSQMPQQQYQQPQQVPHQQPQQIPNHQIPQQQKQIPSHQIPQQQQGHVSQHGQILNAQNMEHEREHLGEHLHAQIDTSKMTEQELQFHYFKMHDSDNNNKLDGCELIKSLIHWHAQGKDAHGQGVEEKIFSDEELQSLIDPILNTDDASRDGFIDYPEFIRAQQKAAVQKQQQQDDDR